MNDRTWKIILPLFGAAGATACAVSVFLFSGIKNTLGLILLCTLAGTLGNILFTQLGKLLMRAIKSRMRGRPGAAVYAFNQLPPEEFAPAGGKGRVLAKLYQAGFPVPDGCILLPSAFIGDEVTGEAWEKAREQLARLRRGKTLSFAVRSSALSEDSAQASFAGEFESVLDVCSDEEIRAAVRVVLQSRHHARVQAYSQAQGLDMQEHPVAVIIQKLVTADYSGVLFTADPLTGNLMQMSGNFVPGMGDKLVSGQVSAAKLTIERPEGRYNGPPELARIAKTLHREAHAIENELGGPQDIEWAVCKGRLSILQARPITTLNGYNPTSAQWNDSLKGSFLWSATNLMEACPDVLTPFTASLLTYLNTRGGPALTVKNYPLNGIINGRFYANISVQVSAFLPMFKGDAHRAYREMSGWWGEIPAEMQIPLLPLTKAEWQQTILPMLWRTIRQFSSYRKKAPQFLAENRQHCADLLENIRQEKHPAGLLALWDERIFPRYRDTLFHVIAASSDAQVRLERDLKDLVGADEANALLSNLGGRFARLESLGPMAGLGMVLRGEMSREEYLENYGHRGVNEGECAWPRPLEDPHWLERQLAEWSRSPVDVQALLDRQKAAYEAAWQRFCQKHPKKIKTIARRIEQAARAAHQREAVRSESTRGMMVLRAFALRAGELLGLGEDVFFLTIDEALASLAGEALPTRHIPTRKETWQRYRDLPPYPALICGRFDPLAWAADSKRRSDVFDAHLQVSAPPAKDARLITGAAGALGVVEGNVRRLDNPDDSEQFQKGEVLLTTMTNIGWTPLFPRAAAIITDLGAPLSHAAIVARELGIPAVVGCGDATMRLKTGDRVRVDGGRGTVEILSQ